MFFTVAASVLDTLLIKTSVFVLSQSFNLIHIGGAALYYSYVGRPLTKEDILQIEIETLKEDIELLKLNKNNDINDDPSEENNYGVLIL
jgi:hypothetical protein